MPVRIVRSNLKNELIVKYYVYQHRHINRKINLLKLGIYAMNRFPLQYGSGKV